MSEGARWRLSLMMFLNYVIWGAWYVTITTYLTATLKFSGTEAGYVFGTFALASMISPFFVGLVADRFFATERVLASLHFAGAILLYLVTLASSFAMVYALMLLYCICYCPTIALTNTTQTYSATPKSVTVTTTPATLATAVTYDSSATVPQTSGSKPSGCTSLVWELARSHVIGTAKATTPGSARNASNARANMTQS